MMILNGHTPIIPYHIDKSFFNLSRGKIPVTWIMDIRFLDLSLVDKEFPITKFNPLTLLSDYPFQKHDSTPGKPNHDDIKPFGFGKESTQPPAEIEPSVVIGGLHASSTNRKGDTDIAKKKIGQKGNQEDPDQELGCEGGKKEFSNLIRDRHPL